MEIVEREEGDVTILAVKGSLMVGSEIQTFHERVKDLVTRDRVKVVVDFDQVDFCGSVMLGQLTASKSTLVSKGGDIRFANVSPKLGALLRVTGLNRVFEQYSSVAEALRGFEETQSA